MDRPRPVELLPVLDGVEAIKESPGGEGGETCCGVGKDNGSLLVHADSEVSTAVLRAFPRMLLKMRLRAEGSRHRSTRLSGS